MTTDMRSQRVKVGIIGFGFLGRGIYHRIISEPELGLDVAFVWNRSAQKLVGLAPGIELADLNGASDRNPDLIVEVAHPCITREYGMMFLELADYLPLSVSALVDDTLYRNLRKIAAAGGKRLLIPHGALVGVDSLLDCSANWSEVMIAFEKHPTAIDFSESGIEGSTITERTVVFAGTAREIGRRFPRNVNTMVTCAIATIGLDRCSARLIADPAVNVGIAIVEAKGKDGATLTIRKEQPMAGVSGTEMFESVFGSILRATGGRGPVDFV